MKKTSKIISFSLCLAALAGSIPAKAEKDIIVEFNGNAIEFDVKPQITNGCTMVPIRKIFEEIGALVKWDAETQTVQARKSAKTITFKIGSSELNIDKGKTDSDGNSITETVNLETPAMIVSGRTLVPLRAISESFGLDVNWNEDEKKVSVNDKEDDDTWKENVGSLNLSDLTYSGNGIEITDNQILITSGGDYTLTGTLEDGNIKISTNEKVKLRLNGASITSSQNPCIYAESADKLYITLTDGSENNLEAKNSENGAIYSKDNIEIKGKGTLNISSSTGHAIKASDNLTIENGEINLTALSDGIHVNDTFKMTGGNVNISSVGDGIDSESIAIISGGKLNIETKGEPITTEKAENNDFDMHRQGMPEESQDVEFEKSSKGINAEWMMSISGGEIDITSASHAIHCQDEIEITGGIFNLYSEYEKGISAHGNLTISNSDTVINVKKSTEGIESKNIATINDGTIRIIASDDGINATGGNSGEMPGGGMPRMNDNTDGKRRNQAQDSENSPQMPEDFKKQDFNNINKDTQQNNDGAMPKRDNRGFGNIPGANHENIKKNLSDCLVINGGDIEIFAEDDCLDSNGNLILNGGTIKAVKENGTFTGFNSVLDPDGTITIKQGVTLIAAGIGGIQETLEIPQNTVTVYCTQQHSAEDKIVLKNAEGDELISYLPGGKYSAVLITSPQLEIGKGYTVSLGSEDYSLTLSEQSTTIGNQKNDFFPRPKRNETEN